MQNNTASKHATSRSSTPPINITITAAHIRTKHRLLPKHNMPQILHHPPRDVVVQRRVEHPLAKMLIVRPGPTTHLGGANGELRAARRGDDGGGRLRRAHEGSPVVGHGDFGGAGRVVGVAVELELGGTADGGVAAEVGVAGCLDVGGLEHVQGGDVGVGGRVGVPAAGVAVLVGVDEGDGVGEGVVVVDDVGEVGEGLAAFVAAGVQRGGEVVDGVDEGGPA